ncbi:MAG TPA: GNAT family protein [Acidimicrobiia bacterium]|nr:GNAT family protein [Acidimicrobiia bacterium]
MGDAARWPTFDLRLRTPRLELRPYREADIPALIEAARSGIHDPGYMPFGVAWTDAPSPEFERNWYRHYWQVLATTSPEKWALMFAVYVDDEPIGIQDVGADAFPTLRTVLSGSWLRADRQGEGLGKEMRTAILTLAFDGLGAEVATSGSRTDNHSSIGVSRAMGYDEDGFDRMAPRGEAVEVIRWRVRRDRFEELRASGHYAKWEPVEIEGLDPVRDLLGL